MFIFNSYVYAKKSKPEDTFIEYVNAIQSGNLNIAYNYEYIEQKKAYGKFKHEIESLKKDFIRNFYNNPMISKCRNNSNLDICKLGFFNSNNSIVVKLYFPRGTNYEIADKVILDGTRYSAQRYSKLYVKVKYNDGKGPVLVNDVKLIDLILENKKIDLKSANCYSANKIISKDSCIWYELNNNSHEIPKYCYNIKHINYPKLVVELLEYNDKWYLKSVNNENTEVLKNSAIDYTNFEKKIMNIWANKDNLSEGFCYEEDNNFPFSKKYQFKLSIKSGDQTTGKILGDIIWFPSLKKTKYNGKLYNNSVYFELENHTKIYLYESNNTISGIWNNWGDVFSKGNAYLFFNTLEIEEHQEMIEKRLSSYNKKKNTIKKKVIVPLNKNVIEQTIN
jgi:hypothetical protein